MENVSLLMLETIIANCMTYGMGPWDALWSVATRYNIDGDDIAQLPKSVLRSIVANAKAIREERVRVREAIVREQFKKHIPIPANVVPYNPMVSSGSECPKVRATDGKRLYTPCNCETCRVQWSASSWADEMANKTDGVATEVTKIPYAPRMVKPSDVSAKVDATYHEKLGVMVNPKHVIKETRFAFNETYFAYRLNDRRKHADGVADPVERTPDDVCVKCQMERKPKDELNEKERRRMVRLPHTCFLDKGSKLKRPTGPCEKLFLRGERKSDGFSRTIALRYLQRRMVFNTTGHAKGKADPANTVRGSKTSSSKHSPAFASASDIEDVINDAYVLFLSGEITLSGNKLRDTCNCCRRARTTLMRGRHRDRIEFVADYAADLDANGHRPGAMSARDIANRFYTDDSDPELTALMLHVREHGFADQKTLAAQLGVSEWKLGRQLAQLEARKRHEEMLAERE